jgi:hypothetical protein
MPSRPRPPSPKTKNAAAVSMLSTSQPKFMPKNPVTKVSGRKIVAISVSR